MAYTDRQSILDIYIIASNFRKLKLTLNTLKTPPRSEKGSVPNWDLKQYIRGIVVESRIWIDSLIELHLVVGVAVVAVVATVAVGVFASFSRNWSLLLLTANHEPHGDTV